MTERLIEKLDRLGAEAGIKQMTPEVYRFALDVRKDLVSEWPKRPDSYDHGVKDALETIVQLIKELRPAIRASEVMGKGKPTEEWFDILAGAIKEKNT